MMSDYRKVLRPRARRPWAAWLVAMLLLLAAGWMAEQAMRDAVATERWRVTLQAAQARRAVRPAAPPSRADQERQRQWAALAAERRFSWYPVFRSLEQANSADIELLEFLPDKPSRRLTLRGEARNIAALTDYLAALSAQPAFTEVYLSQQKNSNRAGMALVNFEIRCTLREELLIPQQK